MSNQDTVEIKWILSVIRNRLPIIIIVPILAIVGMLIVTLFQKPVYETSVVLYIQPNPNASTNNYNQIMAGEQLAQTYSEVLMGPTVMQAVISELGLKETPDELAQKITVVTVKNTQLIKVIVSDPSPEQAALLANTIAAIFITQVESLEGDRYTVSLKSIQEKFKTENATISEIQKNIDLLNAENVARNVELNRQELLLNDLRNDYRVVQQNQQSLQLAISQIPDTVKVVEEAQPSNLASYPVVTVMVAQPPASSGTNFALPQTPDQMALTFTQLVTAKPVLEMTIKEMNITMTADQLALMISAQPVAGTQLIEITFLNPSSPQRLLLLNALANAFVKQAQAMISDPYTNQLGNLDEQAKSLSASIDEAQTKIQTLTAKKVQADTDLSRLNNDLTNHLTTSRALQTNYDQMLMTLSNATDTVVIAEKAIPPKSPIRHLGLNLMISLGLGLVIGVILAFVLEQVDSQILTKQDLDSALGLPLIGSIGKLPKDSQDLVIQSKPTSSIAEDFRVLGANIRLSTFDKPLKRILITSATSEDGKSLIAANLAVVLAQTGIKVALVDADLRVPRVQQIFNCNAKTGLTDALLNGKIDGAIQASPFEGLSIITSGHIPPDPTAILNSPKLITLLNNVDQKVDLVIIDSPAILAAADTSILSTLVDGVIFVVRAGYTRSQDAKDGLERLRQANAPLIGTTLNSASGHSDQNYYTQRNRRPVNRWSRAVQHYISLRWDQVMGLLGNHRL